MLTLSTNGGVSSARSECNVKNLLEDLLFHDKLQISGQSWIGCYRPVHHSETVADVPSASMLSSFGCTSNSVEEPYSRAAQLTLLGWIELARPSSYAAEKGHGDCCGRCDETCIVAVTRNWGANQQHRVSSYSHHMSTILTSESRTDSKTFPTHRLPVF